MKAQLLNEAPSDVSEVEMDKNLKNEFKIHLKITNSLIHTNQQPPMNTN